MKLYSSIQTLVEKAIEEELIHPLDEIYARNQIMDCFKLDSFPSSVETDMSKEIPDLLDELTEIAVEMEIIENLFDLKEIFSCNIMNVFISKPSEVNQKYWGEYKNSPENATDYFYKLSKASNYIQTKRVARNIEYKHDTEYGELDITINLSKPEKDPKQIAAEKNMKRSDVRYPECLLCVENEGYAGRIGHPARASHRLVHYDLDGESWLLQYSPYVYYNEHCIVLSSKHVDMRISRSTMERLLSFVEVTPHYFVGSNADLPIVGGSILTHDHYQGGKYEFAFMKAGGEYSFSMSSFPEVKAEVVKWPMSVIRLKGNNKEMMTDAADFILGKWRAYSDEEAGIYAFSGDVPHNTVTPIARMKNGEFIIDLVLRNNRTSDEHPLGIFHPHADIHHIKKENIGLIEVMGLAVLPGRLNQELTEVEKFLLGAENDIQEHHKPWADILKEKYKETLNSSNVNEIVRKEVGEKFLRCLVDAGVYKKDANGLEAFKRFTDSL